jgi:hypothetical protein
VASDQDDRAHKAALLEPANELQSGDARHAHVRDNAIERFGATTNYGMLYTAKGTASLLVPLSSVLTAATGSWQAVLYVAALLNIVAAVMALLVLKPMRQRTMAQDGSA